MGSIDEIIEKRIHEKVKEILAEILEPVLILKDFEGVDVLNFDETCQILRLLPEELENAIKSRSVPCVKLGKSRSTWRFPKYQMAMLLIGEWKPEKKAKVKTQKHDFKAIAKEFIS